MFGLVFVGDPVEERRRVDFVQGLGVGRQALALVALVEDRLDPLVFAVGRQVGADVERLAAAGRDRHQAFEHDEVADRPGDDRDQQGDEQQRRRRRAPAASPRRPRQTRIAARTTKAPATSRYSGRNIAVRPKRRPGTSQAHGRSCSPAHRKARIGGGQGEDRRRLAHQLAGRVDERRVDGDREGGEQAGPAGERPGDGLGLARRADRRAPRRQPAAPSAKTTRIAAVPISASTIRAVPSRAPPVRKKEAA